MAVRRSHATPHVLWNSVDGDRVEMVDHPIADQDLEKSQARFRVRPCRGNEEPPQKVLSLRVIKWTALCIVALCLWTTTVMSKVTLVSITARMFNLTSKASPSEKEERDRSVLFIQLVFLMLIPEVFSFFRCLFYGVFGKTTTKFPWPSKNAVVWVSVMLPPICSQTV